jgi:putative ABC transport system permease protein
MLGRRGRVEAELREEIDAHIAMRIAYLMERGYSQGEAERESRSRFGDLDQTMRRLYASARDRDQRMRKRESLEDLRQDLRLTMRMFRRSPLFVAAAVFTLALGIGANGAVFSILQATLLQPLPYRDPANVVMIWRAWENPPDDPVAAKLPDWQRGGLTAEQLEGLYKNGSSALSGAAGIQSWRGNLDAQFDLALSDRAERLRGAYVTPNFFELLGVRATHGRVFGATDEASGEPLLVLGHDLWQRNFGGDTGIVGRSVTLTVGRRPRELRTFTVLGVLPKAFRFSYPTETEAWAMLPWSSLAAFSRNAIAFNAVARLAPGHTLAQAQAIAATQRAGLDRPGDTPQTRQMLRLEPVREWIVGDSRPSLYLLAGVAALLLLITCATVANGLLARLSERREELALRASLGADRGRLVRQLLTEGGTLSLLGVAAGLVVAVSVQPVLRMLMPASLPRIGDVAVNGWIFAFAAFAAVVSTVLAALVPALGGTRADGSATFLRVGAGSTADRRTVRWRQGLIAAQTTIATTLLIAAVLLLASFWRLGHVPLGFDGDEVLTVEMRLLDEKYNPADARMAFQDRLVERLRATPGVIDVGLTSAVPFRGVDFFMTLPRLGGTKEFPGSGRMVDDGYFSVLRIPLLRGRLFAAQDVATAPKVMVISESYARKAFGSEDPLGKFMNRNGPVEIVGVVGDVRYEGLDREPREAVYFPRSQNPEALLCVVVRGTLPGSVLGPAIIRAIHDVDPALPAMRLTTIGRIIDESVASRRFYTLATLAFSVIALLLTVVGLSVVVARVVAERRRELAIRSALGAALSHLVGQATRDGLAAVAIGLAAGIAGAYASAVLLKQFLYAVDPRSLAAYGIVAALVLAITVMAAWLAARRLGRMPLAPTLRAE